MIRRHLALVAVLVLIGAILFQIFVTSRPPTGTLVDTDLRSWQRADNAPGYKVGGIAPPFALGFITPSAFEIAALPVVTETSYAMGGRNGANTYNAQSAGEPNSARGGRHSGDDWNGIGGMNTDLGDPVFAIADGSVLFSAMGSLGWGNIVILGHRTAGGRLLQSFYAHLDTRLVQRGQSISRGETIGTVGTAGGNYLAHLHLELREMPSIHSQMRGYHANALPSLYLSPREFLETYAAKETYAPISSLIVHAARLQSRKNEGMRYTFPE